MTESERGAWPPSDVEMRRCCSSSRSPWRSVFPNLTERSPWFDEASSWQTARFPFPELMQSVRMNVHMPLYGYALAEGVDGRPGRVGRIDPRFLGRVRRGDRSGHGRLWPRTVSGAPPRPRATEPDRLDDRAWTFGLVVAGLVAISPCQIFASIEARMYSLGTALAALSSWMLLRILRDGGRGWLWWWYGAAMIASSPTSITTPFFTAAAQFVFLGLFVFYLAILGHRDHARAIFVRALTAGTVAALVYLPGLSILMAQTARVQQDYWVRPLSWEIFFGTFNEFILPMPDYDQLPNGWIAFAAFVASCLSVSWKGRRGDGFVLALAIVPMVLSALVSTITPIWAGRFFRFTQLFALAAVALRGVARLGAGRLRNLRRILVRAACSSDCSRQTSGSGNCSTSGGDGASRARWSSSSPSGSQAKPLSRSTSRSISPRSITSAGRRRSGWSSLRSISSGART